MSTYMKLDDCESILSSRRAQVVGIGMVGGSVAAALRQRGWHVTGQDLDTVRAEEAKSRGIVDAIGIDSTAEITFVATPVSSIADVAMPLLGNGGVVTDVASVKGPVVSGVSDSRFVGGHPMAGSERSGLDGVDPDLFEGATWVLTPTDVTSSNAYLEVFNVVSSLGAAVVTLDPSDHDEIVATISHVPHLTATALMTLALQRSQDHDTVLRLAAGGFRDMTRIAAGDSSLWADIVLENKAAIAAELDLLEKSLAELRSLVDDDNREELQRLLDVAARARKELPIRGGRPTELSSLRIVIADRSGALGEVLGLLGELHVNIEDIEIAHDPKGDRGSLLLTVATASVDVAKSALNERGFKVSVEAL